MYLSSSAPARIYGTPKMHKFSSTDSFPKLPPIVSSIDTFNYNLARFLLFSSVIFFHLKYLMITREKILFLLFRKLRMQIFPKFLISYNLTSLFSHIPLQETIDITTNLIFHHNSNLNITKEELKKLFLFATSQIHFILSSKFFNQIDRVAMGSYLAPVFANIFMAFYKSKWLNKYNLNKPKLYLRYVGEILAAFDKEQDTLNFQNFLNKRHPNIKYTIEKQINYSIAFLDVFISGNNNQNLTLQTFYKSIYTGFLLNFKSFKSF